MIKACYIDVFSDKYKMTIGADFKAQKFEVDGEEVTLQIWDIAGQFRTNHSVTRNFFKDASGVIIAFSLAGKSSPNVNNVRGSVNEL